MSIERRYFRSSGTTVNPGIGAPWDASSPGNFYPLVTTRVNSTMTTISSSTSGIAGAKQIAAVGWVGNPEPDDRRLAGSLEFMMRAYENSAANDAKLALQVLVYSEDGTVKRGDLFYGVSAAELPELTLTGIRIQGALTPVDILAGDRIAVIVGFDIANIATSSISNALSVGDPNAATELTEGSTNPSRPWIDFTWVDPPLEPINLSITELKARQLTVQFFAAPTGPPATGFDVRINGKTPIYTTETSRTFTNLKEDSAQLVEVRAVDTATGQYSPWVPLEVTTPPLVQVVRWDNPDDRLYQTGCDRGALYFDDGSAVAWNGITGVDETGTGTSSVLYRDGEIYYSDVDPSDFTATIKAFFWPDQFGKCLGIPQITDGLYVDNQKPRKFNFTYRNLVGSGGKGDRFGYQIHLVYNALAVIGTRSRKTRTNQVTLDEFTFDIVATPVKMPGLRPSAHYIIDTRTMDKPTVKALEDILYAEGRLPEPQELYDLMNFGNAITFIDHGDGTWTARGSSENLIDKGDGTWIIKNVLGTNNGDGTFILEDTPA